MKNNYTQHFVNRPFALLTVSLHALELIINIVILSFEAKH